MYTVQPVSRDNASVFRGLSLTAFQPMLDRLAMLPNVVGTGATLFGAPVGLALAVTPPGATTARLLSLFIAPAYRHAKVGTALMRRMIDELRAHGTTGVEALVPGDAAGACALTGFFSSLGWAQPTLDSVRYVAEHQRMLSAPWLCANADLGDDYDVLPWVELGDDERESIRARQSEHPWFPPDLDPFHHERGLDVTTSLALRHRGAVVGWMITHRPLPAELSYTCGFVRTDLARRGRFIPLLRAVLVREVATAPEAEHIGIWSTPAHHAAMIRFERTHMAPFSRSVVETQRHFAGFDGGGTQPSVAANRSRCGVALVPAACVRVSDVQRCAEVTASVQRACSEWSRVHSALDVRGAGDAAARAIAAPLLPSITQSLSRMLGEPVRVRADPPAPTVIVVTADRLAQLPLASLVAPAATLHDVGSAHAPLAITLPLAVPSGGAAWTCWELADEETIGLADVEMHALLDARAHVERPMTEGVLAVHDARAYRQLAPLRGARDGESLILLQAIARWTTGDGWVLHG